MIVHIGCDDALPPDERWAWTQVRGGWNRTLIPETATLDEIIGAVTIAVALMTAVAPPGITRRGRE